MHKGMGLFVRNAAPGPFFLQTFFSSLYYTSFIDEQGPMIDADLCPLPRVPRRIAWTLGDLGVRGVTECPSFFLLGVSVFRF